MVRLAVDTNIRTIWREYAADGLTVFPLKKGGKNPGTDFGIRWQSEWVQVGRATFPELADTYETGTYGLWLATGQVSKRVVLDLDTPQSETYWRDKLGEVVFNTALKVTTGRGKHLHFRIRADDTRPWPGHSDEQVGFDFRGDGGGVVMPPSVHKTGRVYEWLGGELQDAPDILRKENQPQQQSARENGGTSTGSTLAKELMLPPDDPGRGNNWLARVAGYLAKSERRYYDRYVALVLNINWASSDPIEESALMKTVESIWNSEHNKPETHNQDNGWLIGDGARLFTQCEIGSGDEKKLVPGEWADFDIRVRSITRASDGTLVYTVDLHTDNHDYEGVQLDPAVFATDSKLSQWLAIRGATILPVPFDKYSGYPHRTRLAKYLKSQKADSSNAVRFLGWNSDLKEFITHEGVVDNVNLSLRPYDGSVPDPILASWAPYFYGMVDSAQAAEVLREVLTYQDENVTSVFAAWWAMALLKGRFQTSQFPFMSIEAPSESGKSTGFFAMMVALAGNTNGHGRYTAPAFRDALAGHRNGITWLDDMTEIGDLQDMIRQLTAEGHWSKKGMDRRETETVQLLCPLVVSGEGLGSVMSEKAMRDRAIALEVTSPKGRKSTKDPSRPQWDDIQDMLGKYSDDGKPEAMSKVAGTLVGLVHQQAPMLAELKNLRTTNGRHGDKMAIIRMGARIIAAITDDPTHIERVDSWCRLQQDEGSINYAIGEIVPWFLRSNLIPTSAKGHIAAFYDSKADTVWVSPAKLADAWRARGGLSAREKQLGTEDAIRAELKANDVDTRGKPKWTFRSGDSGTKARYCSLEGALATLVMDRVGATMDDVE
jgi:hypothetical protein